MSYRQISFRVFNEKTNKWIYGPKQEINLFGEYILFGEFMNGVSIQDLNDCVALQFTGLKDKNGVDIYEGDILKIVIIPGPEDYEAKLLPVIFKDGQFICDTDLLGYDFRELGFDNHKLDAEIVGNIYDNPELIK